MEGLGRNPEPFRYARRMDNPGVELFINVCILLIVLIVAQIFLKRWDKRAKAKEAAEVAAKAAKPVKKTKKK